LLYIGFQLSVFSNQLSVFSLVQVNDKTSGKNRLIGFLPLWI